MGPLCCAKTAVMGGDTEVGGRHPPLCTQGLRGAQPMALGCQGGRVSPKWGSGLGSPHGQRRNQQCQCEIRLIFGVPESPHRALTWPRDPACSGCTGLCKAACAGTAVHPQCHFGVYPEKLGHSGPPHPSQQQPARWARSCTAALWLLGAGADLQSEVCRQARAVPPLPMEMRGISPGTQRAKHPGKDLTANIDEGQRFHKTRGTAGHPSGSRYRGEILHT